VREQRHLTWENAIRKMTALPATIAGMVDRGYLAVGMRADITVFDTATVIDRATYEEPGLRSEGIRHVMVNGVVTFRDGQVTGSKGGRALYRGSWMPSRPMTAQSAPRRLMVAGLAEPISDNGIPLRVFLNISQARNARRATGALRLTDPASGEVVEAIALGVLQTYEKWGSVTGVARRKSNGDEQVFTLTWERADPFVEGSPQTLTWDVGGSVTRAVVK
jgi:hypothetical protein